MDLNYTITNNSLHIENSYKTTNTFNMKQMLLLIRNKNISKNYDILKRTDKNLIREWKSHNLLYNFHIMRNHTASVDFEYPQHLLFKVIYFIISIFYNNKK